MAKIIGKHSSLGALHEETKQQVGEDNNADTMYTLNNDKLSQSIV